MKYSHLMCTQGISLDQTLTEWAPFDPFDPKLYTLVVTNWYLHTFLDYCPRTRFIIIPFDNGSPIHRTRKGWTDGFIGKLNRTWVLPTTLLVSQSGTDRLTTAYDKRKTCQTRQFRISTGGGVGLAGVYLSVAHDRELTEWLTRAEQITTSTSVVLKFASTNTDICVVCVSHSVVVVVYLVEWWY